MPSLFRRILFGRPLPTHAERHQRLTNLLALPVFASDALSSSAYATEEILLVLASAGAAGFMRLSPALAIGIAVLVAIVATSYRQTIHAYPEGGGAYRVTSENLGRLPGLTAAAALLTDYVLTVSVSIAAGVAAITSAFAPLSPYRVELAAGLVLFIMLANLRGVRESGILFAVPTYAFIVMLSILILAGLWRMLQGDLKTPLEFNPPLTAHPPSLAGALPLIVILRAFASGCAALTGIEAVCDGVPAFRPPEARNAARTLGWLAIILIFLVTGLTSLSFAAGLVPYPPEAVGGPEVHRHTVISQLAVTVFGYGSPLYFAVQAATAIILVLAANTAFADFPRLSMFLARDRFLPRQMANIGDRLVFSNGIFVLAALAIGILVLFHASVHQLIPLYAVGVFLSFTLSQSGMVVRWWKRRGPNWVRGMLINGLGAVATGVVLLVIASVKFADGAWMVIVLIPLLVLMFLKIRAHYEEVAAQLSMERFEGVRPFRHTVLVLVPDVHRGIMQALAYARTLSPHVRAVYIDLDPEKTQRMLERWQRWVEDIPLVVLESPYRGLVEPLLRYLDEVEAEREDDIVTVIIPEFVTPKWWTKLLHNQSGLLLKFALLFRKGVVVTNVRYYLEDLAERPAEAPRPAEIPETAGVSRETAAPGPRPPGAPPGQA